MPPILDRKPSPPDARDYQLRDYLSTTTVPPADASYADKTVRDLAAEGISWAFFLRIWALIKTLIGGAPTPPTPPTPPPPPPASGSVIWPDAEQLDQGSTGHCVGFGCSQWENTLPIDDHATNPSAHALYYQVKGIELGRPVADYQPPGSGPSDVEDGAFVRDGMKALKANGRLSVYAAADTTDTVTAWIRAHGPVVIGSDWLAGMDAVSATTGLMKATGASRGGHCYCLVGHVPAGVATPEGHTFTVDVYRMQNSWGSGWALGGFAYISVTDMAKLLAAQGESWAAAEVA